MDQTRSQTSTAKTEASAAHAEAFGSSVSMEDLLKTVRATRRHIVTMIAKAGSGHPGGSLSCVEILTALYFRELRLDPTNPRWPGRDRFVLSKGHAAPALYTMLAQRGYLSLEELPTLRHVDSRLQGHTDMLLTPGVEITAGSLGHGLSVGIGMALAGKLDGAAYRTYVLLGDGECDEGQVWEAVMAAAHFKLDNLVAIIDHNQLQLDGSTREIMNLDPMMPKFQCFGWETLEIDGHDLSQVLWALKQARKVRGRPTAIVARTVKGKGVSFMENNVDFHGKAPNPQELAQALKELS